MERVCRQTSLLFHQNEFRFLFNNFDFAVTDVKKIFLGKRKRS